MSTRWQIELAEARMLRTVVLLLSTALLSAGETTIKFTEYPIAAVGFPASVAAGSDGALWFPFICDYNCPPGAANDSIGRMTTTGAYTQFQLPPTPGTNIRSRPLRITSGPDGALWFTESRPAPINRIGRITPAGAITEFQLPYTALPFSSFPYGITSGSDGALWFVQATSNLIVRMSTSGSITGYPIPGGDTPAGSEITAGPDGALWFAMFDRNSIGRVTTAGVFTTYPLGFDCAPQGIAAGPDNAVWFACYRDSIGRISANGVISRYPVPTQGSMPTNITAGPDGALWFTEQFVNQVGRITTDGIVTEYSFPVSRPYGSTMSVTKGLDGNLWFATITGDDVTNQRGSLVKGVVSRSDTSPATIVPEISGTLGNNGWYRSSVSVAWRVADLESGITSSTGCATTALMSNTPGTTLTCTATNGVGLSNSVSVTIKIDQTPPVILGMPAPGCTLWPPNGKMVQVGMVTASDGLSALAQGTFIVTGTSNEPASAPQISVTPDGSGGFIVQLQADRLGSGTGRLYTLTATANDLAGNMTRATAICKVPHDQGN